MPRPRALNSFPRQFWEIINRTALGKECFSTMPVEQTDRKATGDQTPKFPGTKRDQPQSKGSTQGTDHRGHEQDDNAGAKDHRRRVDAGDARKHAQ